MVRLRVAELLGRPLPSWTRLRVFRAAYDDLLGDYLLARRNAKTARRWKLRLTFETRALVMTLECWRLALRDRIRAEPLPRRSAPPPDTPPRRENPMDSFLRDLRYAVRQLAASPVFTATAVLIVAIGIGANTAAFSVVNAMLLRPQPFERPEELVDIYQDSDDGQPNSSSFPAYRDIAAYEDLFAGVAATFVSSTRLQRDDALTQAQIEFATSNYLQVLGLRPTIGRWFDATEDRAGGEAVAVLSYRAWQEEFGADPGVLGTVLRMNGAPVTVVGVGPQGYNGYLPVNVVDAWLSLSSLGPLNGAYAMATLEERGDHWFFVKARLRQGVTAAQAQEAMSGLAARLEREFPEHNTGRDITVFSAGAVRVHPEIDPTLVPSAAVLMTIVGLVLLIACSNLANLLLVRAAARGQEISIRVALGANRGQVARQLLTESVLLSLCGGLLGVLLASWAVRALMAVQLPLPVSLSTELALDGRVLGFALVLSVLTGVLFGFAPALRASRPDLGGAMRDEAASMGTRDRRFGLRNGLVVVQVAISFVLLAGAGLFIRSLGNAQDIDTGFAVDDVAYLQINPGFAGYDTGDGRNVMMTLVERARALPGIEEASLTSLLPVSPRGTTSLVMEGYEPPSGQNSVEVPFAVVDARYFETLRIPLLHGRTFDSTDNADGERVAVVNESLALRYFGDSNAVGRRFRSEGSPDSWRRVIGVVGDAVIRDLTETTGPQVYFHWEQTGASAGVVLARTAADPAAVVGMLRAELRDIDGDIPVLRAGTMAEHLADSLAAPRLAVRFLSGFGAVALVLASLGLYGVVSFAVGRRMLEVGVRMALGARSDQVLWLVLREVTLLVGAGIILGIGLSVAANAALAGLLFGVSPADPLTLTMVAVVLLVVAVGAAMIPARRAATADPVVALRQA
jgi:predicted permease